MRAAGCLACFSLLACLLVAAGAVGESKCGMVESALGNCVEEPLAARPVEELDELIAEHQAALTELKAARRQVPARDAQLGRSSTPPLCVRLREGGGG